MRIFYSPRFSDHDPGAGHPESPERLRAILSALKASGLDFGICEPSPARASELERVHAAAYLERLADLSSARAFFPDNPFSTDTFEIARLAAGAARDAALSSFTEFSFALVRPPGHHAGRESFGGFCYLNNIAVASSALLAQGVERLLLVDFDVHHGNGTQEIFLEDGRVLFLSFNQLPEATYPFNPALARLNTGHVRNVCYPAGVSDAAFLTLFRAHVKKAVREFAPEAIGVSAGFDIFAEDVSCGTATGIRNLATFEKLGGIIASARLPAFAVLEGGYFLPKLGESVVSFMRPFA